MIPPTLATERLVLRALSSADLDDLHAFGSDPRVVRYTGRLAEVDLAATRARFERIEASLVEGGMRWGIVRDARVVGTVGVWNYSERHRSAELGYDLAPECWGQGLMSEALRAVIPVAFERVALHRLAAHVDPDNVASIRLLERLGFTLEGRTRDSFRYLDGRVGDTAIFGILSGEWR